MKTTRRDLLAWSGGAVAGMLFTPVPWKVMSDLSVWTQNWPWIPQPPRGPVDVKLTSCTLCPHGCGLRVRMASGAPVGLSGRPDHPVSRGALCPLAFGAHQLNWHPSRLREVRHRGRTASWNEASAAFRKALAEGPVAIVDGRGGRAASQVFARFAAAHGGPYAVVRSPEERALAPYARWSGVPASSLGYDLENARTILSFGAPMLDGWGTPGRFTRLWSERAAGSADPALRLIQVEPEPSRTSDLAWKRVRVAPNGESALAAALARALLDENLAATHGPRPEAAPGDSDRALARLLMERPPVVAIAREDNEAVAALNFVLGAIGARGGIVRRSGEAQSAPPMESLTGPVRAVLIDSTVPWEVAPNIDAEVFRFAAWHGGSTRADWLLPAPGLFEELSDVPTPPGSAIETYAVAPALLAAPDWARSAAQFLAEIDPAAGSVEKLIQERAGKLGLADGAVWSGPPPAPGGIHCDLRDWPRSTTRPGPDSPRLAWTAGWTLPVLPPLASKLYQESNLRESPRGNI